MSRPRFVRRDDGETLITHVPSVRLEGGGRTVHRPAIRLRFRLLAALVAALCLIVVLPGPGSVDSAWVRILEFCFAGVFGALALMPGAISSHRATPWRGSSAWGRMTRFRSIQARI